jgi:hypothetical protein
MRELHHAFIFCGVIGAQRFTGIIDRVTCERCKKKLRKTHSAKTSTDSDDSTQQEDTTS